VLLAVDVGNTQTVIGVFEDAPPGRAERKPGELPGLLHSWRAATVATRTADEHALLLQQLLGLAGIALPVNGTRAAPPDAPMVTGVVVSSSVPAVAATLREMVARWTPLPLVVVGPGIRTGMAVRYENPREVGPDRIVNAVAALDLHGGPAVVVDLGTATTFDVLSAEGDYLGGAIVPGLEISMDALFEHAAALPRIALGEVRRVIGRSTVESMQAGAIYGHAALIDGMCERIRDELGTCTTIATGGLAPVVVPHARCIEHTEPWLTLHGLRLLWARNRDEVGQ
jgi:type III pantothenate kinase